MRATLYADRRPGSDLTPALERLPRVQARYLPEPPIIVKYLPFVLAAPIKIIHQVVSILLVLLVYIEKPPEFLVVQVCLASPTSSTIAQGQTRTLPVSPRSHSCSWSGEFVEARLLLTGIILDTASLRSRSERSTCSSAYQNGRPFLRPSLHEV